MSLIHIARNNTVLGQFTDAEVRAGLANGTYLPSDLAWKAGKKNWEPLENWPEFTDRPPPLRGEEMLAQPGIAGTAEAPAMPSWERPESGSLWHRLVASTKEVLLNSADTFSAMPQDGGYGRPLYYYLIPQLVTGILVAITVTMVITISGPSLAEKHPEMQTLLKIGPIGAGLAYLAMYAIGAPIGIFIWSAIQHALLHLWGAANSGYETTFRTIAYVQGAIALICIPVSVLSAIPVIGTIFALCAFVVQIYGMVVLIQALAKTHGAPTARVVGAVLSPFILCCCCGGIGVFGMATSMAAKMHH